MSETPKKKTECPEPGIYRGVPLVEYLSWEAASFHRLKDLSQSAAHCFYNIHHPDEVTDAMLEGDLVHKLVLQPELVAENYRVMPDCDRRTNVGKLEYSKFMNSLPANCRGIKEAQFEKCEAIARAINEHETARIFTTALDYIETSIVWNCSLTGVLCKARIDGYKSELQALIDLKTCQDASTGEFSKQIVNFKYAHQLAFYIGGMRHFEELSAVKFAVIVAAEKEPFNGVAVYRLKPDDLDKAFSEVIQTLGYYGECQETGIWPSYPDEVVNLNLPPWAFKE